MEINQVQLAGWCAVLAGVDALLDNGMIDEARESINNVYREINNILAQIPD